MHPCPYSTLFSGPMDPMGLCVHPGLWSFPPTGAVAGPIRPLVVVQSLGHRLKNPVGTGLVKVNDQGTYNIEQGGALGVELVRSCRLLGGVSRRLREPAGHLHCHQLQVTA